MRNNFCRLIEPELKKLDADVPLDLMGMLWSPFHMTERNGYIHVPVESFQETTNFLTDHALHLAAVRQQHVGKDVLQQRLAEAEEDTFQARVLPWMNACFGAQISADKQERNHRFLEEALELIQACGATAEEAHQLVDYVYGRPVGEPSQEVGGVMVTLAALCLAQDMDLQGAAETELSRIWGKVEQIRSKQTAKPAFGPLPGSYPERLSDPGCADSERAPAPAVNLPYRKVKTEYSTAKEDAQADAWNAVLDAMQELNR
jgi:hypothetical protein